MAYVNFQRSYVRFKIVYYGPGLCGKTTNLEHLHSLSKGKVEMISLETEGDRTIFFDYLPLSLGRLGGIETVFKLYTVPGQVRYNRTRQMVLRDVDGVVFVADSQAQAMHDNLASLRNLEENLTQEGIDLADLPLVFQYNKRDLPGVLPVEKLDAALNPSGRAAFPASAVSGDNVRETLTAIAQHVFLQASQRYGLTTTRSVPATPVREPAEEPPAPGAGSDEAITVPPPRLLGPPAGAIEDPPLFAVAPETTRAPEPPRAEIAAGFERIVASQIRDLGESMRQLAMTQLDRDAFDEAALDLGRRIGLLGSEVERVARVLESMSSAILSVHERLGSLRDELRRDTRRQVEALLEEYLKGAGGGTGAGPVALSRVEVGGAAGRRA